MKIRSVTEWLLTCPDPEEVENLLLGLNFLNFAIESTDDGNFARVYTDDETIIDELCQRLGCELVQKRISQERDWFKYLQLKPFEIVPGIWVDPTHKLRKNAIIIKMKPSVAFGTGDHPTTKLVARLMYNYLKSGDRVLDVGCGTGILSIVAKKLGARKVIAVDNDPVAVEIASRFSRINRVKIEVKLSNLLENVDGKFDLIVANLTTDLVLKLLERIEKVMHSHSVVIVSGIFAIDTERVSTFALQRGLKIDEEAELEGWKAFVMKKC
ncbi:50S ribosomal protein L11 methyltransferase [Pseudothermotoga sp.]|uniref:50S ribosomal protein L11 methyltransferase n=1 Tax=Pseudothermotoga sp. TaxID=2033661 RepID=UPI0031F6C4E7